MSEESLEDEQESAAKPRQDGKGIRHFSMSVINFWLDTFLLALLAAYGWSVAVLRIVFPRPSDSAGYKLWGWNFDQWFDFQFTLICVFAVVAVVHIMLHWKWVCTVVANQVLRAKSRPDDAMQTIYGVGTLVVLLHLIAIGVIAAMASLIHPAQ
jgi:hypothetical protein